MLNQQIIQPRSIVVVGGSNNVQKPGGKVLKNLIDKCFGGELLVVNPKEDEVQGIKSYTDVAQLPQVDLAILAIAAKFCPDTVKILAETKQTKAFIILSAGFGEESEAGKLLENKIVETVNAHNACLIGPNCIGVLTQHYAGVFTLPIPKLDNRGVDFISGSGATAVFIMEAGIPKGLTFSSVFSVGNSAQIGVEEVLEYLDNTFDESSSSKVKLLYIESIKKPQKLLKHASSLINKGCRIAAIKSGASEAGSRAASSHTGALAGSDVAVDALFRKAGIVRCYGREDLIAVASVFMHKPLIGKNIAVITHAGGPAVMLTDSLSKGGLHIPPIKGEMADELLSKLFAGSSVANPIDFLATGTAEQLGTIIDYCDQHFDTIDAMVVIFGSPGLVEIFDAYNVLNEKMNTCSKPIYPVLPSIVTAHMEVEFFISNGRINFPDEVMLGNALSKIYNTPKPSLLIENEDDALKNKLHSAIQHSPNGYLPADVVNKLLDLVEIPQVKWAVAKSKTDAVKAASDLSFPLVMKVLGPIHKTDVGGVRLNVKNNTEVEQVFGELMQIKGAESVLIQPMIRGVELFAGASYEPNFGHLLLCGLGGIFIEVLKDTASALVPVNEQEALQMIESLKGYKLFEGVRGKQPINKTVFAQIIVKLSKLLYLMPQIKELDFNPLLADGDTITVVDARIRIEK